MAKESEASKQAKLKGYTSIGFGRWVDKNGELVAFTTKAGRLAPYEGPEQTPKSHRGSGQEPEEPETDFVKPFVKNAGFQGIHRSDAMAQGQPSAEPPPSQDELRAKYDYYAARYAAESLLLLLRWIAAGELDEKDFRFYTSRNFGEYAVTMKSAVIEFNGALLALKAHLTDKIEADSGQVTFTLKSLAAASKLDPELLHVMLMDLTKRGPSAVYARVMKLWYAEAAEEYNPETKILQYNYSEVEEPDTVSPEQNEDPLSGDTHD